eukprot:TRINITY_DN1235_c2_g1_i1.p1 TRINITY_DN1235_c2_g1~~TRINITY_DN1235_c2_g1_i1.p1  ORF type:complete len:332 (+),score=112.46 TRINITY_DN1235_c2_g1_i1:53-1048(+)
MDPAMLQEMLDNTSWTQTIKSMPPNIQKRTKGLQGIQEEQYELHQNELKELRELKEKFMKQCEPWWDERKKIVAGEGTVTEEIAKEGIAFLNKKAEDEDDDEDDKPEPVDIKSTVTDAVKKGIPDFWLKVLQGAESIEMLIQEWDMPILSHLTDITCEDKEDSLKIIFHFSENEYFSNDKLFKTILLEYDNVLGDYNVNSISGTDIEWKSGKNVTQKTEKKRKKKGAGQVSYVTKTTPQESFFTFFNSIGENDDDDDDDDDQEYEQMELATMFRDLIVTRAVELYCGEIDDDIDSEDETGSGSSDEDDSDDEKPAKKGAKDDKPAEECKQQ